VKVLLFTHEKKESGKATILSNILLGLIVNGKKVCVVNIDEDRKLLSYLGLEKQGKKLVYSYVSECVVANLLEISENREEQLIQWYGMYYPKFDYMLINVSESNLHWVESQLEAILELQKIHIVTSLESASAYKKLHELETLAPVIVYNGVEHTQIPEELLVFPRLTEISEGTIEGRPYIYFNSEDETADVLWDFFDAFIEKISF